MPKKVQARAAQDEREAQQLRKLAMSRHGPADWVVRARMVLRSWDGLDVDAIAAELQCCAKTVRLHLKRFNEQGLDELGDRPRPGRPARLSETERGKILALASKPARDHYNGRGMEPWKQEMSKPRPSGVWMRWLRQRNSLGSRSSVVKSDVFSCAKGSDGVGRIVGATVMTKISSQKNGGRYPLRRPARGLDNRLHR